MHEPGAQRPSAREGRGPLPKLRLPSAARLEGLLDSLRLPRVRDRRAVPAVLALTLVAGAVIGLAQLLSSRVPGAAFPRQPQDVPPAALEQRLRAATDRLDDNPEDLQALVEAGTLHFLKGPEFHRTAINELEQARRLGAMEPRIFYYLGVMYQEAGLLPYAVEHYQAFIRNFPEDREARLLLGKLLYQTGRYEDAAVQYQSLKGPRAKFDPVVEENLGLSLLALKRFDEASLSFSALLAHPAFEPRARYYLGQVSFELGRFEQAREHFDRAAIASLAPTGLAGIEPVALWAAIAANDEKREDWTAAKERWEKVLQLDSKSAKAKSSLARVKAKLAAAERAARRAAAPKPASRPKPRKK
ncbi:MAG: tetratricopeptide repeat protein [Elusimicrobia bacterium]|nr:tetratricopeptide repeat protein [Elusimicrobiota bacterium]